MDSLIRKSIKSIFEDNRDSIFKNIEIKRKFGGAKTRIQHTINKACVAGTAQREARVVPELAPPLRRHAVGSGKFLFNYGD